MREEVARFNAVPSTVFEGLVMAEGGRPASRGFAMSEPGWVDWEVRASEAVEAFGRNRFFVLFDGRQVTDLDQPLQLSADSDVRFVRLVQLIGG